MPYDLWDDRKGPSANIYEKTREEGRERQEREGRRGERDGGKGEGAECSHHWDPSRLEAGRWALVQTHPTRSAFPSRPHTLCRTPSPPPRPGWRGCCGPCCSADCPMRSRAVPQGSRLRMTPACLGFRLVTMLVFPKARLVTTTVALAPPSLLQHLTDLFSAITGDLQFYLPAIAPLRNHIQHFRGAELLRISAS